MRAHSSSGTGKMDVAAAEGHAVFTFCTSLKFNEPNDWVPPMPPCKHNFYYTLHDIALANRAIKYNTAASEDVADWHFFLFSVYKFLATVELSRRGVYPQNAHLRPLLTAFAVTVITSVSHNLNTNLVAQIAVGIVLDDTERQGTKDSKRPWTPAETELLHALFVQYGRQWTRMARFFTNRTSVSIRNQYYRCIHTAKKSDTLEQPESPELTEPTEPSEPTELLEPPEPTESSGHTVPTDEPESSVTVDYLARTLLNMSETWTHPIMPPPLV